MYSGNKIIGIWAPNYFGDKKFLSIVDLPIDSTYVVQSAFAGPEAIRERLSSDRSGLDYYAQKHFDLVKLLTGQ